MSKSEVISSEKYNIFAICQDFRQRIEQLNRLKEEMMNKQKSED
ncbi:MAG: hypothetical protein P8N47_04090 [Bacteroidia bacterium]|jgi:hypothetical protein|nr:hypothetical protein [Bacteroidia bacterium]